MGWISYGVVLNQRRRWREKSEKENFVVWETRGFCVVFLQSLSFSSNELIYRHFPLIKQFKRAFNVDTTHYTYLYTSTWKHTFPLIPPPPPPPNHYTTLSWSFPWYSFSLEIFSWRRPVPVTVTTERVQNIHTLLSISTLIKVILNKLKLLMNAYTRY